MKNYCYFLSLLSILLLTTSCQKEELEARDHPRIQTLAVSDVSAHGATLHGEVLVSGKESVLEYGFVWNEGLSQPRLEDSHKEVHQQTLGIGTFSGNITLTAIKRNQVYSVRAFVKTASYTVYGNQINFNGK